MSFRIFLAATFAVTVPLALAGCMSTGSVNRIQAEDTKIQNTKTVDEPFDVVWDRAVKNLSQDFFVINNVEKASHIINVSLSSNNPAEFVDCGRSSREFKNLAIGRQHFEYNNADAHIEFLSASPDGFPVKTISTKSLDGRANIYIAPSSINANGTDISVNIRYTITSNATLYGMNQYGVIVGAPYTFPTETWLFDTNKSAIVANDNGAIRCASKGIIEQKILDATNK